MFTRLAAELLPLHQPLRASIYHKSGEILFHVGDRINEEHIHCLREAKIEFVIEASDVENIDEKINLELKTLPVDVNKIKVGETLLYDLVDEKYTKLVKAGEKITIDDYKIINVLGQKARLLKNEEELDLDQVNLYRELVNKIEQPKSAALINVLRKKLLIVEDEARIREIIKHYLSEYTLLEAENGKDAIKIINENQDIDLVITDVNMPIMDGFELCRVIKQFQQTRHIPVILCTVRNTREDIITALKVGANDYIIKPFNRVSVVEKVRILLQPQEWAVSTHGERRQSDRVAVKMTMSWAPTDKIAREFIFRSPVINLSLTGLSFAHRPDRVQSHYPSGTVPLTHTLYAFSKVYKTGKPVHIYLESENDVIEISGKVVYVRFDTIHAHEVIGIEFTTVSETTQDKLLGIIEKNK